MRWMSGMNDFSRKSKGGAIGLWMPPSSRVLKSPMILGINFLEHSYFNNLLASKC